MSDNPTIWRMARAYYEHGALHEDHLLYCSWDALEQHYKDGYYDAMHAALKELRALDPQTVYEASVEGLVKSPFPLDGGFNFAAAWTAAIDKLLEVK